MLFYVGEAIVTGDATVVAPEWLHQSGYSRVVAPERLQQSGCTRAVAAEWLRQSDCAGAVSSKQRCIIYLVMIK